MYTPNPLTLNPNHTNIGNLCDSLVSGFHVKESSLAKIKKKQPQCLRLPLQRFPLPMIKKKTAAMCATLLAVFFMFKSLFAKIQATNRKDTHLKRKYASLERQARILKSLLF
jgi:hypothetical protein